MTERRGSLVAIEDLKVKHDGALSMARHNYFKLERPRIPVFIFSHRDNPR
jgi:hypothetical protein